MSVMVVDVRSWGRGEDLCDLIAVGRINKIILIG